MNPRTARSPLLKLFWGLYLVLGLISIGVGALLVNAPGLFFPGQGHEHALIRIIGIVFLLFGIARIVSSVINLRRKR